MRRSPLALCAAWLRRGQRQDLRLGVPLQERTVPQEGEALEVGVGLREEEVGLVEEGVSHLESV